MTMTSLKTMTVTELMEHLTQMPSDALVYIQDKRQGEDEIIGAVESVRLDTVLGQERMGGAGIVFIRS